MTAPAREAAPRSGALPRHLSTPARGRHQSALPRDDPAFPDGALPRCDPERAHVSRLRCAPPVAPGSGGSGFGGGARPLRHPPPRSGRGPSSASSRTRRCRSRSRRAPGSRRCRPGCASRAGSMNSSTGSHGWSRYARIRSNSSRSWARWRGSLGGFVVQGLTGITTATVRIVFLLFVMLYAMFFFLKDGRGVLRKVLYYLPLSDEDERRMLDRFVSVTRAMVKGTVLIGIVQGGLAGLAFWVVGIPSAAFWGDGHGGAVDRARHRVRARVAARGDLPARRRTDRSRGRAAALVRRRGGDARQPHAPLARGGATPACPTS